MSLVNFECVCIHFTYGFTYFKHGCHTTTITTSLQLKKEKLQIDSLYLCVSYMFKSPIVKK